VAAHVARGMANKEAASALMLSVETVQFHLTHIYAKLGLRSRSELAAYLSRPPTG
jgi:DNA-binding CsgD family transcriptional regulator